MSYPPESIWRNLNTSKLYDDVFTVTVSSANVLATISSGSLYASIFNGSNTIWAYEAVCTTAGNPAGLTMSVYRTSQTDGTTVTDAINRADRIHAIGLDVNQVSTDRIEELHMNKLPLKIAANTAGTYRISIRTLYK